MTRKLSAITTAKVAILSETTKGKVGKAERQRKWWRKLSKMSRFNNSNGKIYRKLPILVRCLAFQDRYAGYQYRICLRYLQISK